VGLWKEGKRHGRGKMFDAEGNEIEEGLWLKGEKITDSITL
jgi:hypothetical protein